MEAREFWTHGLEAHATAVHHDAQKNHPSTHTQNFEMSAPRPTNIQNLPEWRTNE